MLQTCYRFEVYLPDGYFRVHDDPPTGWTHVVLNYIGANDEDDGIVIFIDGEKVGSETDKILFSESLPTGDGRIVVGRKHTDGNWGYASVQVDELIFFNQSLTREKVPLLSTGVWNNFFWTVQQTHIKVRLKLVHTIAATAIFHLQN